MRLGNQLDRTARKIRRKYIKYYSRTVTWITCGRKFDTKIDPLDIFWVDPDDIQYAQSFDGRDEIKYSDSICEVIDGDWDQMRLDFDELEYYDSFQKRFNFGYDWEKTQFYQRVRDEIREQENWSKWGCEDLDDFEDRLYKIDRLYENVINKGYRTQADLLECKEDTIRKKEISVPPQLHEVTVNIARDGEYIFYDGRHRLTIAQIANVDSIPIRVKARHKTWQELRDDQLHRNGDCDHPDLSETLK